MVYIEVSLGWAVFDYASFPVKPPEVPMLVVNPSSLYFIAGIDQSLPPQNISIEECGSREISWSITDDADWLYEDPTSGITPSSVEVSVDSSGLLTMALLL